MINAGKYDHKIRIVREIKSKDADGFPVVTRELVLETWAAVKTTSGYTIIANNSDFEKALTNFTIRFPKTEIDRKMIIEYRDKVYEIRYLNNVDERGVELEIQAKEVTH